MLALASTSKQYATGLAREARRAMVLALPPRAHTHIINFQVSFPAECAHYVLKYDERSTCSRTLYEHVEYQCRGALHAHIPWHTYVLRSRMRSAAEC